MMHHSHRRHPEEPMVIRSAIRESAFLAWAPSSFFPWFTDAPTNTPGGVHSSGEYKQNTTAEQGNTHIYTISSIDIPFFETRAANFQPLHGLTGTKSGTLHKLTLTINICSSLKVTSKKVAERMTPPLVHIFVQDTAFSADKASGQAISMHFEKRSHRRMTPSSSYVLVATIASLILIFSGLTELASASPKALSPSESLFRSPFEPCKGSRILHPVEAVRAHVVFTKAFNKIGIKPMISLATKYQIPAICLYPLAKFSCWHIVVINGFLSDSGTLALPKKLPTAVYDSLARRVLFARARQSPNFTMMHGTTRCVYPVALFKDIYEDLMPVYYEAGGPLDGDLALSVVLHVMRILL